MLGTTTFFGESDFILFRSVKEKLIVKMVCAVVIVLLLCSGCESSRQAKGAAKERWGKASSKIKLALAQQQYGNGNYKEATKLAGECISADPGMPGGHLLMGKLLMAEGSTGKAMNEFRQVVELNGELAEGWYWLGIGEQESGRAEDALACYNKAMELEPTTTEYILAAAEMHAARKAYEQAMSLLEEKMALVPKDVSLKVAAADLMSRTGKDTQAVGLYRQAMLIAGEDSGIAESLGYCYLFSGRWKEAGEIFGRLSEQSSDETHRRLYLRVTGMCSMNSAEYDRAVNCYSKLSVEQRENAEVWLKMGQAALGAGMTERALRCAQKAALLQPGYTDAIALTGCVHYAMRDYSASALNFRKVTGDEKYSGLAWLMLARCYERLGQAQQAQTAYKNALEIKPRSELGDFLAKGVQHQ